MSHVPGRSSRQLATVALGLIGVGAVLRLAKFLQNPGLWVDEAMIAVNIGRRSFAQLAEPLDYIQLAPVPWLWLEKLLVEIGGMHELVLRTPALLAGVLLPWLVWRAGLHLVGEWGAVVATALTTASSALIFFSSETKPYGTDAAIAALLLLLAGRCLTRPPGDSTLRTLGVIGTLAVLCSFPSVFTLGGIGIALLVRAGLARNARAAGTVMGWGVIWLLAFAIPQAMLYRVVGNGGPMRAFWRPSMARLGEPGFMERASNAVNALLQPLVGIEVWPGSELYLALFVIGAWAVARKRGAVAMLVVVVPLLLLGVAWLLDQIPSNDRLLLFAAPILALLIGSSVAEAMHRIPYRIRTIGTIPIVLLIGWVMLSEAQRGMRREKSSGGRELVALVQQAPERPVWLSRWGISVFVFYTTDWTSPDTSRLDWYAAQPKDGWLTAGVPTFDDGLTRVRQWDRRLERIAGPSGVRSEAGGLRDAGTAGQWATNEARLVWPLARDRPWVLMIHEKPPEHAAILTAFRDAGMSVDSVAAQKRSSLWQLGVANAQAPRTVSNSSMEPQR